MCNVQFCIYSIKNAFLMGVILQYLNMLISYDWACSDRLVFLWEEIFKVLAIVTIILNQKVFPKTQKPWPRCQNFSLFSSFKPSWPPWRNDSMFLGWGGPAMCMLQWLGWSCPSVAAFALWLEMWPANTTSWSAELVIWEIFWPIKVWSAQGQTHKIFT